MNLGSSYLYPPPKKSEIPILSVVVEKKGDESRTSMKQSEIHCYSQWIRIGSGSMIMPRIHYNKFEPGEWFISTPVYATNRYEELADEKELEDIEKIKPSDYQLCRIPPTCCKNGNVQIQCAFVLCPSFIQKPNTKNSFGAYKKLYLLNIGQGFIQSLHPRFHSLSASQIYYGIFEFRAKDNGAVNFSPRSELRTQKEKILERDCMWELVEVLDKVVGSRDTKDMKVALRKLRECARTYDEELEERRRRSEDVPESSRAPSNDSFEFRSLEEVLLYRSTVIVREEAVQKWKDLETGQMSTDNDILIFKFNARHNVDSRIFVTPSSSSSSSSSLHGTVQEADVSRHILELRADNNANPRSQ